MKHRRKIVVVLASTAMSLGMLATAGTASAGTNANAYVSGGRVEFVANGDRFAVYDTKADGFGIAVRYRYVGDYSNVRVNNGGAGSVKVFDASNSHNLNEGWALQLQACRTDKSVIWDCGSWVNAKA